VEEGSTGNLEMKKASPGRKKDLSGKEKGSKDWILDSVGGGYILKEVGDKGNLKNPG